MLGVIDRIAMLRSTARGDNLGPTDKGGHPDAALPLMELH